MNPNCFKAIYQGDEVWFISSEAYAYATPHDAIVYTLAEAAVLANRSDWTKKIAHEAKKVASARVAKQSGLL